MGGRWVEMDGGGWKVGGGGWRCVEMGEQFSMTHKNIYLKKSVMFVCFN